MTEVNLFVFRHKMFEELKLNISYTFCGIAKGQIALGELLCQPQTVLCWLWREPTLELGVRKKILHFLGY